jgi:hypothetical protein
MLPALYKRLRRTRSELTRKLFVFEFNNVCTNFIQKTTIMTNNNNRVRIAYQIPFQPDHCLQIQVIRRFVFRQKENLEKAIHWLDTKVRAHKTEGQ